MVISEVFRDRVADAPLAGPVMLLEGLQAGIAGQLAMQVKPVQALQIQGDLPIQAHRLP